MARKLQRKHGIGLIALVVVLFVALAQAEGWLGSITGSSPNAPGVYTINHYIDGDTISVDINGKAQDVRFIGVDTPETQKPNTLVQCYGPAAAAYTKNRISAAGGKVRLTADSQTNDKDQYGRLLRYVYLPNGVDLNEQLLVNGYGFFSPYLPFSKSTLFNAEEQSAIIAKKGLWTACTPAPSDKGGYKMNETQAQADGK